VSDVLLFFMGLFLVIRCFTVVPSGSIGIVDVYGKVSDRILRPGLHVVKPFAKVAKFSTGIQEARESVDVTLKDGSMARIGFSVQYRLVPEKATSVYRQAGKHFQQTVLIPWLRLIAKRTAAQQEAAGLSIGRDALIRRIQNELVSIVNPAGIVVESVRMVDFVPSSRVDEVPAFSISP